MERSGIGGFNTEEHEFFAHSLDVFNAPTTEKLLTDGKDVIYSPISTITGNTSLKPIFIQNTICLLFPF